MLGAEYGFLPSDIEKAYLTDSMVDAVEDMH